MKSIKIFAFLLAISFLLSGCAASNLSDMTVVQAIGVDSVGDGVQLSLQYLDLSKGSGTIDNLDSNITGITSSRANNISDAVSRASADLSSPIFFGQNKIVVLGVNYAKNGIANSVDYVLRAVDCRSDVMIAMSDTDAKSVVDVSESRAKVPAEDVFDMIKTGERQGMSVMVYANDLLNVVSSKASDLYLPILSVNNKKASLIGIGVFSKGRYVERLTLDETLGFLIVNKRVNNATIILDDDKLGKVGVSLKNVKVKNSVSFVNDQFRFNTKVKLDLTLNDTEKGVTVSVAGKDMKRLEKLANKELETLCRSSVKKCFSNNSDPFMMNKMLAKKYPHKYEELVDEWRDLLPNVNYSASVSSSLDMVSDNATKG